MNAALLTGYAIVVAWSAPLLLRPLTSRGISARLGLAAWLTAPASSYPWNRVSRPGGRAGRSRQVRKVRAPQGKVVGNADPG